MAWNQGFLGLGNGILAAPILRELARYPSSSASVSFFGDVAQGREAAPGLLPMTMTLSLSLLSLVGNVLRRLRAAMRRSAVGPVAANFHTCPNS